MERVEKKPILSSAIRAMLNTNTADKEEKAEKVVAEKKERVSSPKPPKNDARTRNPKAYQQYRGRDELGNQCKAASFYVTDSLLQAIELRKGRHIAGERDKSAIVRNALMQYLQEEMKLVTK
jgi:hypothetical protein